MIRLVATDLDGTIISGGNRCDSSVAEAVRKLHSAGILFALCTGRPVSSMRHMLAGWGLEELTDYIIGSNGGEVLEMKSGRMETMKALDTETVRDIIDLYEPLGLIPTLYEGRILYVQRQTEDTQRVAERVDVEHRTGDIRELLNTPQVKYMMILDPALMETAERFAAEHPDPRYIAFKTAPDLLEMTEAGLDKGTGLSWVMKENRIRPEEVVAFGDNSNDIPMFRCAEFSVCMKNGSSDALEAAVYHAPSVEENGFADWLDGHLRGNMIKREENGK